MKRKFTAFALLVLVFWGCKSNEERTRITVNSWVGFGPIFVAQEKGIFEKNGLNVEIIKIEEASDRRAALMSGRVDIVGSSLDDLAVTLSQGIDAVAISYADFSNGADAIISKKGITSLDTLKNLPIAVQPGFVNHFFLLYVLDKNGVPIDDLNLVPMEPDDAGAAFISGQIDVAVTWEPHISKAKNSKTGCNILASSREYPEAILDLFTADRKWLDANETEVKAFRDSWDQALDYIQENPKEAYGIIGKEVALEPAVVEEMMSGVKLLNHEQGDKMFNGKSAELSERVERIWRKAGYIKGDIDLEAAFHKD